jgi:hypothetical protein
MGAGGRHHPSDATTLRIPKMNFRELRKGEVRAEGSAAKARNGSDPGNRTGYYSSTNSSRGTPYALAIFVTVGM